MKNKIKRLIAAGTVALAVGGGATVMTVAEAQPAHAAAMTPATLCTVVREGTLVQRPCTFSEWWYLRYYA